MPYSSLPTDILTDIAQLLDLKSAKSLAETCSTWRPAAESRIYRSMHITHADQFLKPNDTISFHPRDPADYSRATGEIFQSRLESLRAHPWRKNQVREFTLELRRPSDFPSSLRALLREISSGLKVLKMILPPLLPPGGSVCDLRQAALAVLISDDLRFPVLEEVEMNVGEFWLESVVSLLKHSPRLRKLCARGVPAHSQAQAQAPIGVQPEGDTNTFLVKGTIPSPRVVAACSRIPEVLQLRHLSVSHLSPGDEVVPLFERIVGNSPYLSSISIQDPGEDDNSIEAITASLSTCGTVTDLEIPSTCLKSMRALDDTQVEEYGGPLTNLNHLTIAWEYADLRACAKDPLVHLFSYLPNLQTCEFMLKSHNSNIPPYDVYRGHLYDLAVQSIRSQALFDQFESTPELVFIQLKDMYGPPQSGPGIASAVAENRPESSTRYLKAREMCIRTSQHRSGKTPIDGAFITRYERDNEDDETETKDRLTYLRHRTAHSCGWEEYAVYNGREMSMPSVSGVMSVNGVGAGQRHVIMPGEGTLNQKAWDVLKHCATLS